MDDKNHDRPALEVTDKMIGAAARVLRDSGIWDEAISGHEALAAEVLEAAILVAGFCPRMPQAYQRASETTQNSP
jgi:hypothetical protein